jgi:hypothetical protein
VTASAIALKKMIHFRILIPSLNLGNYAEYLENTRQKTASRIRKFENGFIALRRPEIQSRNGECYNFVTTLRRFDKGLPDSNRLDQE